MQLNVIQDHTRSREIDQPCYVAVFRDSSPKQCTQFSALLAAQAFFVDMGYPPNPPHMVFTVRDDIDKQLLGTYLELIARKVDPGIRFWFEQADAADVSAT